MTSAVARFGWSSLLGLGLALGSAHALAVPLAINGGVTTNTCPDGGTVRDGGRACEYAGTHTFDSISLTNGAVIYVTSYDNVAANKSTKGNLVLKSTSNITIDGTSRITARGAGYQALQCDNGPGPTASGGGKGGCAVQDSGGGGAHFGRGGKGTKDCFIFGDASTCQFPQEWEEACGTRNADSTCSTTASCYDNDALPDVAGMSYWHHILDPEFGAAGGDKGCRDSYDANSRGGNGGGRVVLFAASGNVNVNGRITADGRRGCASGNDSAGAGAGGTVLIIGDTVNVGSTARISARGGRGGDSQPKALSCTANGDCGSGQLCRTFTEPASGNSYKRCDPANCTPSRAAVPYCDTGYARIRLGGDLGWVCVPTANNPTAYVTCASNANCQAGQQCLDLGGAINKKCVPDNQAICDYLDYGENEDECKVTQNNGTCDDCAGGGGGGIINVQSRVNNIDPRSIFDVRGGNGGICPICAGEAGAGAGELQIDAAYVGEICDGKDNDFNGVVDDGLANINCPAGGAIPACTGGKPNACPTVAACNGPVTDTRPRFALVVDTSGSMLLDVDGEPRFGDGSLDYPGVGGNESRLYTAKGALSDVLAAFPESDYALARYYQDTGLNRSCQTANWFECAQSCCSYDDPRDNTTPAYPYYYPDGQCVPSQLYASPLTPSDDSLGVLSSNINIGWSSPNADCINYSGSCGPPERGAQYLVDFGQPLQSYLKWLDNKETNFLATPACTGGDCELRATGPTPLASSLEATKAFLAPRIACDSAVPCRKYNVILLTDGSESCQGDPQQAAEDLLDGFAKTIGGMTQQISVKTYVIGFSVLDSEKAQLNSIAAAGGTTTATFVSNRIELANQLATIISDSFVFETCDGQDNDCDGQIDEDFPEVQPPTGPGLTCDDGKLGICRGTGHYICKADHSGSFCDIDVAGTTPGTEVCNGLDDNCNGLVDESTPQNPLNCSTCIPQAEVCDGEDNDCDTLIDETDAQDPTGGLIDDDQACGTSIGECGPGLTVCNDGVLECSGATGPFAETCDGLDNDCDNVVDGMSEACYVVTGNTYNTDPESWQNGVCRKGSWKCTATVATPGNPSPSDFGSGGMKANCISQVEPTKEVCDGKDNDCNGTVDDHAELPGGGFAGDQCCGSQAGSHCGVGQCVRGTRQCAGTLAVCVGAGNPSNETCDGADNDCNGVVDDIPSLGGACTAAGGCPGTLVCDSDAHELECQPSGNDAVEVCDGIDNDCDGKTDEVEDVSINEPTFGDDCNEPPEGHREAPCRPGTISCVNGSLECDGDVQPLKEVCDLKDNDCDGAADTLAACPGTNACVSGVCVEPCGGGEFSCPGGYQCKAVEGKRLCLPTSCSGITCPAGAHCEVGACVVDEGTGQGGATSTGTAGASGVEAGAPNASTDGGAATSDGAGGKDDSGATGGAAGEGAAAGGSAGSSGSGSGASAGSGRGVFGLVTGGGGCACRTAPPRGGSAAAALALMVMGAAFVRRRGAAGRRAA